MRRFGGLNLVVAYPGTLGGPIPDPPPGYAYLTEDKVIISTTNGANVITDDEGVPLTDHLGEFLLDGPGAVSFELTTTILTDDNGVPLVAPF